MLFDHWTSENPDFSSSERTGRSVETWHLLPNRDNDWWDCLIGAAVAASTIGVPVPDQAAAPRRSKSKKPRGKGRRRSTMTV